MDKYKLELMNEAISKYEKIFPCNNNSDFSDCYTETEDSLLLWFNTEGNSTHVIAFKIKKAA